MYTVVPCWCHILSFFHYLHASWWDSLKPAYFSLSCLHLWEDTHCATIDQFSPQNSVLAWTLLNYVVVLCMLCLVTGSHCWPWIMVFLHIVCIFGNTKRNVAGVSSSISVCYIFLHCVWLLGKWVYVAYLYDKLLIIEHQFTVCGSFDFIYCVCVCVILLGACASAMAWGSQN